MTDILKLIPPMLTGAELHQELAVNPEYDPAIRQASAAERLVALNALYEVYYPFSMSSTIYSKMYLSMIRSLQKKTGKLAVQQRNANHFGKGQSYFGICNSDSYTLTGASGVGKSTAIARALDLCRGNSVITLQSPYCKILPVLVVQCPWDSSIIISFPVLRKKSLSTHGKRSSRFALSRAPMLQSNSSNQGKLFAGESKIKLSFRTRL